MRNNRHLDSKATQSLNTSVKDTPLKRPCALHHMEGSQSQKLLACLGNFEVKNALFVTAS